MNLLETNRTLGAHIEFTTNCNLKCVYCAVQNKDYIGKDLDLGAIELYIEQLKSRNVLEVTVSGHGETTVIENWHVQCNLLLEQGCKLDIITNLSKKLSADEIDTFSSFNFILVSCDSVHLKTFRALRKGSDLRTVLFNISCIRGRAKSKGRHPPMIGWTSVVCDKNVLDLVDLVNFGLAFGVSFFSFSNVVAYAESVGENSYMHITEMPDEEKASIPGVFQELERILIDANVDYEITAGIRESIEKIKTGQVLLTNDEKESMPQNIIYREKNPIAKSLTRDCLDPWDRVLLRPGGTIHPCFVAEESVGSLSKERPLNEILNGPEIKRYRQGILTGDLVPACRDCHCKAWVSIHEMEKRVTEYLLEYDEPARSGVTETAKTFLIHFRRRVLEKIIASCQKLLR